LKDFADNWNKLFKFELIYYRNIRIIPILNANESLTSIIVDLFELKFALLETK
jgi:hypothetical protein